MARSTNALQLFSGEELQLGGQTGETIAADAGQQGSAGPENRANPQAAAAKDAAPKRMTWEEIVADPEYNREIQAIIRRRLRGAGEDTPQQEQGQSLGDNPFGDHFLSLEQQAEALKQTFPGFDLREALSHPVFARMTAPDVGISVEDAYYAIHRHQIQSAAMEVTAQKTAQMLSDAIRSGAARPRENGAGAQGTSLSALDYRAASRQQRDSLKKRIRQASARGEKVYPGL